VYCEDRDDVVAISDDERRKSRVRHVLHVIGGSPALDQ
jgi:hypothetical protein